ncbi:hypothetical protein T265_13352, partial [Opisthorchis viverrini]
NIRTSLRIRLALTRSELTSPDSTEELFNSIDELVQLLDDVSFDSSQPIKPAKNTVRSPPGSILAVLNRLLISWRFVGVSDSGARASFAAAQSIFGVPLLAASRTAFARPPRGSLAPPTYSVGEGAPIL